MNSHLRVFILCVATLTLGAVGARAAQYVDPAEFGLSRDLGNKIDVHCKDSGDGRIVVWMNTKIGT